MLKFLGAWGEGRRQAADACVGFYWIKQVIPSRTCLAHGSSSTLFVGGLAMPPPHTHTQSLSREVALTGRSLTCNWQAPPPTPPTAPLHWSPASLGMHRGLESRWRLQQSRTGSRVLASPCPAPQPAQSPACPYTHWCLTGPLSGVGVFLSRGAARHVPSTGLPYGQWAS